MTIIIDQREQQPLSFAGLPVETKRGTLPTADYAVALADGTPDRGFAVERKSLDDFAGTVSTGWERFLRELGRMEGAGFPAKVVVIEGNMTQVLDHAYNHPKVLPHFLMSRISELTIKYGVALLFCDNRAATAGNVYHLLARREQELRLAGMIDAVREMVKQ